MNRSILLVVLAGSLLGLPSCVTLSKFNLLKERVDALEKEKALLADRMQRSEERLENLYTRLKESSDDLRVMGADQGATLDELRTMIAETSGKLEELSFRAENQRQQLQAVLDVVDERLGTSIAGTGEALPEDKTALFQAGRERLGQGLYNKARSVFRTFIQRFPKDENTDQAKFMIGESYFLEKKYDLAIREYQELHDQSPKGAMTSKALWRISECLVGMNDCKKAVAVLKYLRETQRKTPEGEKVPDRLKELGKTCK